MDKLTNQIIKSNKKLTRKLYLDAKKEQNRYKSVLRRFISFTDHKAKHLILD